MSWDDRETTFCFNAFLFCYFVSILFCCTIVLSWTTARNISLSILFNFFNFFPTLVFRGFTKIKNKNSNKSSTNRTYNQWMEGHTAWHRLLKYSQNQRLTTQLESMEGSQCESIGLYLSNNATTLSLEHPASVCKITLSLRTIFNQIRILRWCTRTEVGRQEQ